MKLVFIFSGGSVICGDTQIKSSIWLIWILSLPLPPPSTASHRAWISSPRLFFYINTLPQWRSFKILTCFQTSIANITFFSLQEINKTKNLCSYLIYVPIFLRTFLGESEVNLEHYQQVILNILDQFTAVCTLQYLNSLCFLARSSPVEHLCMDSSWCCLIQK